MSYQSLAGMGDHTPPEPVEEPEFKVRVQLDDGVYIEEEFTAKSLNKKIVDIIAVMHDLDEDFPIYLNGTEWNGNQLDNKDMAEL